MHGLYKVTFAVLALVLPAAGQLSAHYEEVFTGPRPGARVAPGTRTAFHQIAWQTSGRPGSCLMNLDYSIDGMVWYLGGLLSTEDCTASGETSVVGPSNVNYVRMNTSSLSNGTSIKATYSGYQTNPGPSGAVSSVFGRTGAVVAMPGDYNVNQITGAASLTSPAFTGIPTAPTATPGNNSNQIATTAFVTQAVAVGGGGGGGTTLNGCSTPTAGNLLCTTSVQGGTGNVGLVTLPYSGSALPTPPTGSIAGIAANGTGVFWSPGNGTAFTQIGTGGGGGGAVSSVFGRTGAVAAASGDYAVAQITGAAPLASPALTGTPTATTASTGDNSTRIATTAWVKLQGYGTGGGGTVPPVGGVTEIQTAGPWTASPSHQMQTIVLTHAGGGDYNLPNAAIATDWCAWVMPSGATSSTYRLTVTSPAVINNLGNAITLPSWQMTRVCQGNAGNYWVDPPLEAGPGITITPTADKITISTGTGAGVVKVNGGVQPVPDGNNATTVDPNQCATMANTAPAAGVRADDVVTFSRQSSGSGWGNGTLVLYPIAYQGSISWRVCNAGANTQTPSTLQINWLVLR